ncbi:CBF/Mak21 family-domain-containing protein [Chytriomyces sp. MP71]|nr:CBF/Mak21 family-domain-containing protein [Chytriomyces sp. MP71]
MANHLRIQSLAKEALASKTGLPGIATLLNLMIADGKNKFSTVHAASAATTHVFCKLIQRGDISKKTVANASDAEQKVVAWLREHLDICINKLNALLLSDEPSHQTLAIDCILKIVREETASLSASQKKSTEWVFDNNTYLKLVQALCRTANQQKDPRHESVIDHVVALLNSWDDLKLYFLRNLGKFAKTSPAELDVAIAYEILSQLQSEKDLSGNNWCGSSVQVSAKSYKKRKHKDDDDDDNEQEEDVASAIPPQSKVTHRKAFTECWLAYLKIQMPADVYKKILLIMHKNIIPRMTQPTLLIDFLTDSYNAGGAVSLLALNGLFTLINEHNLDYPDFYKKLYTLLDDDLLAVKYRSRFFRLLDLFLSSAYLPTYLVAAFVKRLSRLALVASPSAIVIVLPFIYNLLKRHPSVITLIHRVDKDGVDANEFNDRFVMSENDPSKCHSLETSVWELHALASHFLPSVSSLAAIFQEPLTKPFYDIEDFLDLSYDSLFDLEVKKELPEEIPMAVVNKEATGFFTHVLSF